MGKNYYNKDISGGEFVASTQNTAAKNKRLEINIEYDGDIIINIRNGSQTQHNVDEKKDEKSIKEIKLPMEKILDKIGGLPITPPIPQFPSVRAIQAISLNGNPIASAKADVCDFKGGIK